MVFSIIFSKIKKKSFIGLTPIQKIRLTEQINLQIHYNKAISQ